MESADYDLDRLEALIKTTLEQHPSGVTPELMQSKGFRLITPTEYAEALRRKDPEISIWRPLLAEDEETTVAFAFQSKKASDFVLTSLTGEVTSSTSTTGLT